MISMRQMCGCVWERDLQVVRGRVRCKTQCTAGQLLLAHRVYDLSAWVWKGETGNEQHVECVTGVWVCG
jgi:hypothetical protein